MAKFTLEQIVESAAKKFEHVELTVPVFSVDGERIEGATEEVVLRHIMTLPRARRKAFSVALALEERVASLLELPEEERPDSDAVGLFVESVKDALKSVTAGGEERFKLLDDALTRFDPENPDALDKWIDLFNTYNDQIDLEKA